MAIQLALQDAVNRRSKSDNTLQGDRPVEIFSDSQAALRRVRQLGDGPGQAMVQQIHQLERSLADQGVEIRYFWVPSHEGVPGNEAADRAAKQAADDRMDLLQYTTLAHLNRQISERFAQTRKRFITERINRKFVYSGRRTMNPALRKERKRDASVFWQMSCAHALTDSHLKTMRKTDDDACWHCGSGQQMTRTHLFERCTAFKEERRQLWKDIGQVKRDKALSDGKRPQRRVCVGRLFAREEYKEVVMDFLGATKIGRTGRPPEE